MKIFMLKDALGTIDYHRLMRFEKGKVYDVRETAGCRLCMRDEAVMVQDDDNRIACEAW